MGFHGSGWWSILRSEDEKPKVTWGLLKRVFGYSFGYRRKLLGMLLMILVSTGLNLLSPFILRDLIDVTIPSRDMSRLVYLSIGLLMIPIFSGAINVIQRKLNAEVGEGVIFDLRVALYANLQRMSLRFFTNTKVGELMSRLNNDVVGAQNAISNTIVGIVTNVIQTIGYFLVMLALDWRLTLVSLVIFPLFILAARRLGYVLREIARKHMEANAKMNAIVNETLNIGGALLVKLFGQTQEEIKRFRGHAKNVRDIGIQRAVTGMTFFVIIGLLSAVGTALVYGIGGYLVIQDIFTVGKIVAFGSLLSGLYNALQGLASAPVEFATSVVSFERVFEVIDLPYDILEKLDAVKLENVEGELKFEDVSFRYEIKEENLLQDVRRYGRIDDVKNVFSTSKPSQRSLFADDNGGREGYFLEEEAPGYPSRENTLEEITFQARPGELVALVGPSGAGKTTLTYLIPRLYDPTAGRILIDGHDLRNVSLDSLSRQVGMVTQETYLFHDTILTNLVYANPDASQQEIIEAAKIANIHDFIMSLPERYEAVVGERGYRLSGGEKQRIALARVLIKNPRILVLDEATSHLDSESEALIQEALKRVMTGRTSIVIAHRLSTILAADLILVMDKGKVVERGSHQDLLELNGLYSHLYRTQFKTGSKPATK